MGFEKIIIESLCFEREKVLKKESFVLINWLYQVTFVLHARFILVWVNSMAKSMQVQNWGIDALKPEWGITVELRE